MGQALSQAFPNGAPGVPNGTGGVAPMVEDERPEILGDLKVVEPRQPSDERLEENEVGGSPTENMELLKKYREQFIEVEDILIDWAYLEELFAGGADVNAKDGSGYFQLYFLSTMSSLPSGLSLIHDAVRVWDVELVQRLVEEYGADLNMMTNKGVTPIHTSVMANHLDMVNYLITDCEQEINQPVGNKSMLHLAAISQETFIT